MMEGVEGIICSACMETVNPKMMHPGYLVYRCQTDMLIVCFPNRMLFQHWQSSLRQWVTLCNKLSQKTYRSEPTHGISMLHDKYAA